MKRIFISQKMKDKSAEDIQAVRKKAIEDVRRIYGDEEVEIIDSYFEDFDPKKGCVPLKYLAKSLELLADADLAYFADDGYRTTRGCFVEYYCASKYDIPTILAE